MKNHCAFSKNHSCPLWTDYELTCYELEEANSLCHGGYYGAAEPPVRCGESHLSGLTEPLQFVY